MKSIGDIVVVGTDTGVGKSVVSLLLMQLLYAKGYTPFYIKPFQTGCQDPMDADSDARFVYAHTQALQPADPAQSVIYCHQNPKAPYFAAADDGQTIDVDLVHQMIEQKRHQFSPLVVEAAGGLLVPLTEGLLIIDMIKQIRCRPLLVARAGLGTINHTLLSIEALHNRNIDPMGIVVVDGSIVPTDAGHMAENMAAIERFSGCNIAGIIPRLDDFSSPPQAVNEIIETLLTEKR